MYDRVQALYGGDYFVALVGGFPATSGSIRRNRRDLFHAYFVDNRIAVSVLPLDVQAQISLLTTLKFID